MWFEWEEALDRHNREVYGLGFGDTVAVFSDKAAYIRADPSGRGGTDRFTILGKSVGGRLLTVSDCRYGAGTKVEILGARLATAAESRFYTLRKLDRQAPEVSNA